MRGRERESNATAHRQETRDGKQVQSRSWIPMSQLPLCSACIPASQPHGKPFLYNEVSLICLHTSSGFCYCNLFNVISPHHYVVVLGHLLALSLLFYLIQKGLSPSTISCKSRNNDVNQSST